jgi:DNA-binding NarL/FixJ family response regulator
MKHFSRVVAMTDMPLNRTSILFADDHRVLMDSLINILPNEFEVAGIAYDGRTMVEMARQYQPDIIVADISMPGLNGIDAARIIKKELPFTKIVFLTMHNDALLVEEAFRTGAAAFVLKISAAVELLSALRTVVRGGTYITSMIAVDVISALMTSHSEEGSAQTELTCRQRQVLQLIAEGKTMKEVATVMGISVRTAETHKYEIMRKLGVKTIAALVQQAVRMKLV